MFRTFSKFRTGTRSSSSLLVKQFSKRRNFHSSHANFKTSQSHTLLKLGLITATTAPLVVYFYTLQTKAEENEEELLEGAQTNEENKPQPERLSAKYVLIGSGAASYAALEQILRKDPEAQIIIVTEDKEIPYQRPPLSKESWTTEKELSKLNAFKDFEGNLMSVYFRPPDFYNLPNIKFVYGTAKWIEAKERIVTLEDGTNIDYEKCLIATGGKPFIPAQIDEKAQDKVSTFRTLGDFRSLEAKTETTKEIVVVGGSFLGSELSCSLAQRGVHVTQIVSGQGILSNVLPEYLANHTTQKIQTELGVNVKKNSRVMKVEELNGKALITFEDGSTLTSDHVVFATGIVPEVDLAARSSLEIDEVNGGILVNSELMARSDLYVAGDVASYYDMLLGRRRVEHFNHAIWTGICAGLNMSGDRLAFLKHTPYWSDLGKSISFEGVGDTDSKLETVSVWEKPRNEKGEYVEPSQHQPQFQKGIVYYLKDNCVVGVLLWNIRNKSDTAADVIAKKVRVDDVNQLKNFISLEEEDPEKQNIPIN